MNADEFWEMQDAIWPGIRKIAEQLMREKPRITERYVLALALEQWKRENRK